MGPKRKRGESDAESGDEAPVKVKDGRTLLQCVIPYEGTDLKDVVAAVDSYCSAHASVAVRFQVEEGEKKDEKGVGYKHYQLAVHFDKKASHFRTDYAVAQAELTRMTGVDCSTVHVEWPATRLHRVNAWNYANKVKTRISDPYEFNGAKVPKYMSGVPSAQGTRTDLKMFRSDSKVMTAAEISEKYDMIECRYPKYYEKYAPQERLLVKPIVMIVRGPTGVGKTTGLFAAAKDEPVYTAVVDWQNHRLMGYKGEPIVIFENLSSGSIPDSASDWLLALLDRHPIMVNAFGSKTPWLAKRVVFNTTAEIVYTIFPASRLAEFQRRIDRVVYYNVEKKIFEADAQPAPTQKPDVSSFVDIFQSTVLCT